MICVEWFLTRYPTKIFITDATRVRLAPYSIHDYPYLYSRTSVFVFVFEAIRIRIRIRIKIWKQIWFHWYPSVFDPITSLTPSSSAPILWHLQNATTHQNWSGKSCSIRKEYRILHNTEQMSIFTDLQHRPHSFSDKEESGIKGFPTI